MTQILETLEADPALGHVFQAWGAKMDVFWMVLGDGVTGFHRGITGFHRVSLDFIGLSLDFIGFH